MYDHIRSTGGHRTGNRDGGGGGGVGESFPVRAFARTPVSNRLRLPEGTRRISQHVPNPGLRPGTGLHPAVASRRNTPPKFWDLVGHEKEVSTWSSGRFQKVGFCGSPPPPGLGLPLTSRASTPFREQTSQLPYLTWDLGPLPGAHWFLRKFVSWSEHLSR